VDKFLKENRYISTSILFFCFVNSKLSTDFIIKKIKVLFFRKKMVERLQFESLAVAKHKLSIQKGRIFYENHQTFSKRCI
jgi:hypothetical protein